VKRTFEGRTRGAAACVGAVVAAATLAGCPIPQPVPEYPATGVVAPPTILMDLVTPPGTFIPIPASGCSAPVYTLSASIEDLDTTERVDARWFIDYDPSNALTRDPIGGSIEVLVDTTAADPTIRPVPEFGFTAYDVVHGVGAAHVVELVVSNGFAAEPADPPAGWLPNKMPAPQFQTQTYRWLFTYVDPAANPDLVCGYPPP
jgi:hypothetical protein